MYVMCVWYMCVYVSGDGGKNKQSSKGQIITALSSDTQGTHSKTKIMRNFMQIQEIYIMLELIVLNPHKQ